MPQCVSRVLAHWALLAPVVLGVGLVWVYWRRREEPSLLAGYGLFAAVDAVFSLIVLLPRVLSGI